MNSSDLQKHIASPTELSGRVIAITGASSGVGRAVSLACARHGANVILIGRNARKLEEVHTQIEKAGGPEPIIALLDLEKALAKDYDQLVLRGDPGARSFMAFYLRDGRVIAADAVSRPAEFMLAKRLVGGSITATADRLADPAFPLKSLLES